jgi:DNA-binding PadR family transcriptional regulator
MILKNTAIRSWQDSGMKNFGHIYPTLKKMLESGMIETVSQEENDKKRLYKITEKGKQELHLWLLEEYGPAAGAFGVYAENHVFKQSSCG